MSYDDDGPRSPRGVRSRAAGSVYPVRFSIQVSERRSNSGRRDGGAGCEPPGAFIRHLEAIGRGEKRLPNADGSRHHFVPEFMLRRFKGSKSEGGQLYQLDKVDGTCEAVSPKEAGWEDSLYEVESVDGQHNGVIEGLFGLAENYAKPALDRLRAGTLTDDDRSDIAFLIAIQEQRVPGALDDLREFISHAGATHVAVEMANRKGSRRDRRMGQEAYQALVDGRVEVSATRHHALELVPWAIVMLGSGIYSLPWVLLETSDHRFVTSDRPVTMHDPAPPHPWSGLAWQSSPTVAATIPISSRNCLRVAQMDERRFSTRKAERQVDRINLRTYGWARRYVYGPTEQVLLDLHDRAVAEPATVPAPSRRRMVMLEDLDTADPSVAELNRERGWDPYLLVTQDDGTRVPMSYEVIDSMEDAMRSVAPKPDGDPSS